MGSSNHIGLVNALLSGEHGVAARSLAAQLEGPSHIVTLVAMQDPRAQSDAVGVAGSELRKLFLADAVLKDSEFVTEATALPKPNKAWNALVRALMAEATPAAGGTVVVAAGTEVTVTVKAAAAATAGGASSQAAEPTGEGQPTDADYIAALDRVAERCPATEGETPGAGQSKFPDTSGQVEDRVRSQMKRNGKTASTQQVREWLGAFLGTNRDHKFAHFYPEAARQSAPPASKPAGALPTLTLGGAHLAGGLDHANGGQGFPGGKLAKRGGGSKPAKPAAKAGGSTGEHGPENGRKPHGLGWADVADAAETLRPTWDPTLSAEGVLRSLSGYLKDNREDLGIRRDSLINPHFVRQHLIDALPRAEGGSTDVMSAETVAFLRERFPKPEARAHGGESNGRPPCTDAHWFWSSAPGWDARAEIAKILSKVGTTPPVLDEAGVARELSTLAGFPVDGQVVRDLLAKDPFWLLLRYGRGPVNDREPIAWQARLAIVTALSGTPDGKPWDVGPLATRLVDDGVLDGKPIIHIVVVEAWLRNVLSYAKQLGIDTTWVAEAHAAMRAFAEKGLLVPLQRYLREDHRFFGVQRWVNAGATPGSERTPAGAEAGPDSAPRSTELDPMVAAGEFLGVTTGESSAPTPNLSAVKAAVGSENADEVIKATARVIALVACSKTLMGQVPHGQRKAEPPVVAPTQPSSETPTPSKGDGAKDEAAGDSGLKRSDSNAGAPAPTGKKPGGEPPAKAEDPKPAEPTASSGPADTRETGASAQAGGDGKDLTLELVRAAKRSGEQRAADRKRLRAAIKWLRELRDQLKQVEAAKAEVDRQLAEAQATATTVATQAQQQLADQGTRLQGQINDLTRQLETAEADLRQAQETIDQHPQAIADAEDRGREAAQAGAQAAVEAANTARTTAEGERDRVIGRRRSWKRAALTGLCLSLLLVAMLVTTYLVMGNRNSDLRQQLAAATEKGAGGDTSARDSELKAQAGKDAVAGVMNPIDSALTTLGLSKDGSPEDRVKALVTAAQDATSRANKSQGELAAMTATNSALNEQLKAASRPIAVPAPAPAPNLDPEKSRAMKLQAVQSKRDTSNRFPEVEPVAKAIFDEIPATERVAASNLMGDQWVNFIQPYIAKHRESNLAALAAVKARYGKLFPNLSSVEKDANGKLTLESSILWTQVLDQTRNRVKELLQIDAAAAK